MNSDISVESESYTVTSKPRCDNSRSNSVSSMSSTESLKSTLAKSRNDNQSRPSYDEDAIEGEMIRKKAIQQLLWRKTRTYSVDSQEITPRKTIPIPKSRVRDCNTNIKPTRRDTPTINNICNILGDREYGPILVNEYK